MRSEELKMEGLTQFSLSLFPLPVIARNIEGKTGEGAQHHKVFDCIGFHHSGFIFLF